MPQAGLARPTWQLPCMAANSAGIGFSYYSQIDAYHVVGEILNGLKDNVYIRTNLGVAGAIGAELLPEQMGLPSGSNIFSFAVGAPTVTANRTGLDPYPRSDRGSTPDAIGLHGMAEVIASSIHWWNTLLPGRAKMQNFLDAQKMRRQ